MRAAASLISAKTRLDGKFPAPISAAHLGFVVECKTRLDNQSLNLLFVIIVVAGNAAVEFAGGSSRDMGPATVFVGLLKTLPSKSRKPRDVGIMFSQDSGSRAKNNILENQNASQQIGLGVALVSSSSFGVGFDDNVVAKGSNALGMIMSGTDKYRFDSFVGFPNLSPHFGGTNELANSF
jgi:hypothetical protein